MSRPEKKPQERSFTLLETIIALGLMVTVMLEMSSVQGNSINHSDYGRKLTQALWLARAKLSEVEYKSKFYPLKEIAIEAKDQEFEDKYCVKEGEMPCEFKYDITIDKWDLPIVDLALGGMKGKSEDEDSDKEANPFAAMIKDQLKNILGEEILKVAHIEVHWPEGARRNGVELAYLITNQKSIDEFVESLTPVGAENPGQGKCKAGEVFENGKCIATKPPTEAHHPPDTAGGGGEDPAAGGDEN